MDTAHTFAPSAARDDSGMVTALPTGPRELTTLAFDSLMFAHRVKHKRVAAALGVSLRQVRRMRDVADKGWATRDPAVVHAFARCAGLDALTWADMARAYLFGGPDPMPEVADVQDPVRLPAGHPAQRLAA